MGGSKSSMWVIGTVLTSLAVLAAAWFLGVSPRLDSAAAMTLQAESEESRADQLDIQLAALKVDYDNLDEVRAELDALQLQVPQDTELADLVREIDALGAQSQVTITDVSPSPATAVLPTTPTPTDGTAAAPAAAPPAEGAATPPAEGETAAAPADGTSAPAEGTATPQGFYAVPLSITVIGGYDNAMDFVKRLQTGSGRLVLVTTLSATSQDEEGASGGRPATHPGDLEIVVAAYAWVLADMDATAPTETPTETPTEPAPLPVPSGQRNPFAPATT